MAKKKAKGWWVYVLQSLQERPNGRPGFHYVGCTTDPSRRIRQHNGEIVGGAKYTAKHRPWVARACYGPYLDQSQAMKAERALKKGKRGVQRTKWSSKDSKWFRGLGTKHPWVHDNTWKSNMDFCYATLTPEMEVELAAQVVGKTVYDFGCGFSFPYADILSKSGALQVYGFDKEDCTNTFLPSNVEYRKTLFSKMLLGSNTDVALLSWPVNTLSRKDSKSLCEALKSFETVIYVGSNTDGTCCGSKELFDSLKGREIKNVLLHRRNAMVVYGSKARTCGRLTADELVFEELFPKLLSFQEAWSTWI